ncbi:hypothetical protein [Phenylobacterium sp.]|uniref:hypothetical protein n=1 Tax=Phenylobacterium sp. TaxID=1871053 RepID=UPI0011FAC7CC|nr:hypothetical protein [Phenylobacterium sp.]THD64402.1 MAG: hypothetical protein E8A49_02680 [Phenylobacterium sp.]
MVGKAVIDVAAAHKHFSAACFNQAWDLIDKPDRTEADDRLMVALNQASIYHWMNRPDCTDKNLSVGYWQASRIQALLGNAAEAMRHAETCLGYSADLGPFHRGYAYEALARAVSLEPGRPGLADHLARAEALADQVSDAEDRRLLAADLAQLRS